MLKRSDFQKINVVGSSGSGKSTFAQALASKIGAPYLEMDQLFWLPNWKEPSNEEFFRKLEDALKKPQWVLDGNYTRSIPIKWKECTCIVWLDYSFARTTFQSIQRTIRRALSRKELWPGTGNRESFRTSFFSRKSIILWSVQNYGNVVQKYENFMRDPQFAHIKFVRLRSPREAREFLENVAKILK